MKAILLSLLYILLCQHVQSQPNMISKPSPNKNYVLTRTFRDPVKMPNIGDTHTVNVENQTIQYFDGIGRPSQVIEVMASPTFKDVVQHLEYDHFGRERKKFQPYASAADSDGTYKASAAGEVMAFYGTTTSWDTHVKKTPSPYSVTVYENSILNRVQEQGNPGVAWQPLASSSSGHTAKITYGTNTAGGLDAVKMWTLSADGASAYENYGVGKLYRATLRDENSVNTTTRAGSTDKYTDLEGRLVLKRVWESEIKCLDTYYIYDEFGDLRYVIPPSVTVNNFAESSADGNFDKYIYAYKYDGLRRVSEKKVPGKGWEYFVYNKHHRLVLTQDANQRQKKEWKYTRFDPFGRVTSTGLYVNTVVHALTDMQAVVNESTGPPSEARLGADYPSPATTFPIAGSGITITPQIINYYDNYDFTGAATLPASGITRSNKTQSLQTGSKVYKTDGTLPLLTVTYYDDHGRIIQTASKNHLNGSDYVTNTYFFSGELKTTTRMHIPHSGPATTILTTMAYDHIGRPITTREKIGAQAEVILSSNTYNEIGQLKNKAVGKAGTETNFINNTSYMYNERGWLSSSNSAQFSQKLNYEDGGEPYWNGNISQQLWGYGITLTDTFSYHYDKIDRLLSGKSNSTGTAGMTELITYDDMGNISTLKRDAGATTIYSYTGNRLNSISGGTSGSYTYDPNGNATKDRTLTSLSYNYLNLPQTASKTGISVSYLYDANGIKLKKSGIVNGISIARDYIGGIEYNGTSIEIIHNSEGYALKSGNTYIYHYNLKDHLGNVRTTLKRGNTANAVDVVQRDNYYPFGMRKVVAGGNNMYLYNGKEIQGELGGQYDYGARFYDPVIGRWNVIDPMAEQMRRHSPYNYAFNNPVRFIDPDGMVPIKSVLRNDIWYRSLGNEDMTEAHGNPEYDMYGDIDIEQQDPPKKKGQKRSSQGGLPHLSGLHERAKNFSYNKAWELLKEGELWAYFNYVNNNTIPTFTPIGSNVNLFTKLEFKQLQDLVKLGSKEMNAFFKSEGTIIPQREMLEAYKELSTRILKGVRGAPASKATETSIRVQSERLDLVNEVLKNLK